MPLKECLEKERKLCFVGFASPKRGVVGDGVMNFISIIQKEHS